MGGGIFGFLEGGAGRYTSTGKGLFDCKGNVRIWVLSLVSATTRAHIGYISMVQQEDSGIE